MTSKKEQPAPVAKTSQDYQRDHADLHARVDELLAKHESCIDPAEARAVFDELLVAPNRGFLIVGPLEMARLIEKHHEAESLLTQVEEIGNRIATERKTLVTTRDETNRDILTKTIEVLSVKFKQLTKRAEVMLGSLPWTQSKYRIERMLREARRELSEQEDQKVRQEAPGADARRFVGHDPDVDAKIMSATNRIAVLEAELHAAETVTLPDPADRTQWPAEVVEAAHGARAILRRKIWDRLTTGYSALSVAGNDE